MIDTGDQHADALLMARVRAVQLAWNDTPYFSGSQTRGPTGGVDCVRLGTGMADDLFGWRRELPPNLALDTATHDRDEAEAQLRRLLRVYPELDALEVDMETGAYLVQPMDMVVVGPANGGSGHLVVVGWRPNTCWEADRPRVREIGVGSPAGQLGYVVKHAYRFRNRERWLAPDGAGGIG